MSRHTRKVSEYHDRIAQAVTPHRGRDLKQKDIRAAYVEAYPTRTDDLQLLMAADHCLNHTKRHPCGCSRTEHALFEKSGHNRYRVR
jgi:hypothetical protein